MTASSAMTWFALLLTGLDAPAPRDPAVEVMDALRQAQADVDKWVDLAGLAIREGNLREGLRAAEEADSLSRRALYPADAGRIDAARLLARVRYLIAEKEDDATAALRWSSESSRIAIEAAPLRSSND